MTVAHEPTEKGRARRGAVLGRIAPAATVMTVAAVGGGMAIGLSPLLIAALWASVMLVALVGLWWRTARRSSDTSPATAAVFGHFLLASTAVLTAIQIVPFGRAHTNPPVTGEPAWSSPRTRELMVNACYDCHSNEVRWPWYSNIAPLSWAVTEHVEQGRDAVNFSEFATGGDEEADETIETILDGSMPPYYYTLFGLHAEADLTAAEITELVAGLRATPGLADGEGDERDERDDD